MAAEDRDPEKLRAYRKEFKALMADELNRLKTAEQVNKNFDSYFQTLKNTVEAQKLLNEQKKELEKIEAKIKALEEDTANLDEDKIAYFKEQLAEKQEQYELNEKNLKIQKQEASLIKATVGQLKEKTKEIYDANFGFMKMYHYLTDIDKAIKTTALSMGLVGDRADMLRQNIYDASTFAATLGVSVDELGRATANFSSEMGLATIPSRQLLEDFAEVAKGTGASVEEIGRFAGTLSKAGIPANQMKSVMQDVVDSSAEMGLNVSAVESGLRENIGLMNRLHFKDGINGLTKMIQVSERFRLNVSEIASLSEKIFRPEGAIELAANLQMMGGEFSRLGDPLTLMYKARNAPEELAESIGKAAAESAIFNKETGKFKMSALEMDRLRQISEATGMSMESLVEAGKRAAKESQIAGKLAFNVSEEDKTLLASAAEFNKKTGGFEIKLPGGDMVAMKNLTRAQLEAISDNKKSLEERAKAAQTFDESFNNFINTLKTTFLPLIDVLNVLIEPIQWLSKSISEFGPIGKGLTATLLTVFGVGGSLISSAISGAFKNLKVKAADFGSRLIGGGTPDVTKQNNNIPVDKKSPFLTQLSQLKPANLLAIGGAITLIGAGIGAAAFGMSYFVEAFQGMSSEQITGVSIALGIFGLTIVGLALVMTKLSPAILAATGGLLAFGGAIAFIGVGIGIAAAGLGYMASQFALLDPTQVASVSASFISLGTALAALSISIPAMLATTLGILAIADATNSINSEGVNSLATSLKAINEINDEKVDKLSKLFNAAAGGTPLKIEYGGNVKVGGDVSINGIKDSLLSEAFIGTMSRKIYKTLLSEGLLQIEGVDGGYNK